MTTLVLGVVLRVLGVVLRVLGVVLRVLGVVSSVGCCYSGMSSEKRMLAMSERRRLSKQKKEMFGLWCSELYRLSIANKVCLDPF